MACSIASFKTGPRPARTCELAQGHALSGRVAAKAPAARLRSRHPSRSERLSVSAAAPEGPAVQSGVQQPPTEAVAPLWKPSRSGLARQRHAFKQNDGLLYIKNFFRPWTFQGIREECARMRPQLKKEHSATAKERLGVYVPEESAIRKAFEDPTVARRLSDIVGEDVFPSDYPAEYRLYPLGSHMEWHKDEAMYVRPQYELVFTVSNTSDSVTEWRDIEGISHREWTEPNSLIVVRAEAVLHRVLPVTRGERAILKVVFTSTTSRVAAYTENLARTYA